MRVEISLSELMTLALVVYVLSPVDLASESELGARGLIDDLVVIWLLAVGFAAWFALVVVIFEIAAERRAAAASDAPPPRSGWPTFIASVKIRRRH